MKTFTLTDQHITLLRNAYICWEDCETGAPAIDCKRPYGNSNVVGDIVEILGWKEDLGEDLSDTQRAQILAMHYETETALQCILTSGSFEPGVFDYVDWKWHRRV